MIKTMYETVGLGVTKNDEKLTMIGYLWSMYVSNICFHLCKKIWRVVFTALHIGKLLSSLNIEKTSFFVLNGFSYLEVYQNIFTVQYI